jgi:hypothetical protein
LKNNKNSVKQEPLEKGFRLIGMLQGSEVFIKSVKRNFTYNNKKEK